MDFSVSSRCGATRVTVWMLAGNLWRLDFSQTTIFLLVELLGN